LPRRFTLTASRAVLGPLLVRATRTATRAERPGRSGFSARLSRPRLAPATVTFTPLAAPTVTVSPVSRPLLALRTTTVAVLGFVVSDALTGFADTCTGAAATALAAGVATAVAAHAATATLRPRALTGSVSKEGIRRLRTPTVLPDRAVG